MLHSFRQRSKSINISKSLLFCPSCRNIFDSIIDRIAQYKERSAILPGVGSPFPTIVQPDIDLEALFKSRDQLQINLQRRHWIVDVNKLYADFRKWQTLNEQINSTTQEYLNCSELLKQHSHHDPQQSNYYKQKVAELRTNIQQFREQLQPLNAKFLVACLRLPNALHVAVPEKGDVKLIFEHGVQRKSSLTMRSWRDLSEVIKQDATPFSKYSFGEFAQLEYLLLSYFNNELDRHDMNFCSSVNVCKSFVIEAFGRNFADMKNGFNIIEEHPDEEHTVDLYHLYGTASPIGLIAPFIRKNFSTDSLPFFVYSIGRNYSPEHGQSSCIELLCFSNEHSHYLLTDDQKTPQILKEQCEQFERLLKSTITKNDPTSINLQSKSI
ncbi:unnamed protein product, partial [Didymodactylos carnosus]